MNSYKYLLLLSLPVMSNSLQAHGVQASLSLTISRSLPKFMSIALVITYRYLILWYPFSFCPQSFPPSGTFPMSQLFVSDDQNIGASASASVLPMSIQGWFPLRLTGLISLLSKRLSEVFSRTLVWRHQFFGTPPSLKPSSHNHMWPQGSLDYTNLCWQSNVSAFQYTVEVCRRFPAKKQSSSDFMAAVTVFRDSEPKKKSSIIASICHE